MELIIKLDPRRPGNAALNFEVYFGEIENDESLSEDMLGQGRKLSML